MVKDTLYHQITHKYLERSYFKITVTQEIKSINNKIEQNKAQYNLNKETVKTSTLLSGNVTKYWFLTGEDVLPEKALLEKDATIHRCQYLAIRSDWKNKLTLQKINTSLLKTNKC